jgi:hypothetical protein
LEYECRVGTEGRGKVESEGREGEKRKGGNGERGVDLFLPTLPTPNFETAWTFRCAVGGPACQTLPWHLLRRKKAFELAGPRFPSAS